MTDRTKLVGRQLIEERGEAFGRAFEHFILMEILAHRSYGELEYGVHFWRTKSGLEVDFVLAGGAVAVEAKGTSRVDGTDLRSIRAFIEEHRPRKALVVCNERHSRVQEGVEILPWRKFLGRLWSGSLIG